MEALAACTVAVLVACGVYLLLRARTFSVVVGLPLLSYAANLFFLFRGRVLACAPPLVGSGAGGAIADPLPQALVLTAIVIGFAMTAFVLILALRARGELGNDHVDGKGGGR